VDFARLYVLAQGLCFFVTRAKKNMRSTVAAHVPSNDGQDCEATKPFCCRVRLPSAIHPLRRIHYFDPREISLLTFLTNNFSSRFDYHPVDRHVGKWNCFLLDQTAPAHQGFYGTSKRGEDPSLGGLIGLRARGDVKKATGARLSLYKICRFSASQFRENPDSRGVFQLQRRDHRCRTCIQF